MTSIGDFYPSRDRLLGTFREEHGWAGHHLALSMTDFASISAPPAPTVLPCMKLGTWPIAQVLH